LNLSEFFLTLVLQASVSMVRLVAVARGAAETPAKAESRPDQLLGGSFSAPEKRHNLHKDNEADGYLINP
jgi:hypothetical protein